MPRIILTLCFIGFIAFAALVSSGVQAGNLTPDQLREQFAREMPPLWTLTGFSVDTTENAGTEAEPVVNSRFTATATLKETLYFVDGRDGPIAFLRRVAAPGLEKPLTGLVRSVLRCPTWVSAFQLDLPGILETGGAPLAAFPGRVIVRGSEDERDHNDRREAEAVEQHKAEVARLARDEELKALQRAAGLAALEHQRVVMAAELSQREEAQAAVIRREVRLSMLREQEELAAQEEHANLKAAEAEALRRLEEARFAAEQEAAARRARQLDALKESAASPDRAVRVAAIETALASADPATRMLAAEAAVASRDPAIANLALREFLSRRRLLPIALFPMADDPRSVEALGRLGSVFLETGRFDPEKGSLVARLGAPASSLIPPADAVGILALGELTVASPVCTLMLRLSGHQTLDGMLRCLQQPVLNARITLN